MTIYSTITFSSLRHRAATTPVNFGTTKTKPALAQSTTLAKYFSRSTNMKAMTSKAAFTPNASSCGTEAVVKLHKIPEIDISEDGHKLSSSLPSRPHHHHVTISPPSPIPSLPTEVASSPVDNTAVLSSSPRDSIKSSGTRHRKRFSFGHLKQGTKKHKKKQKQKREERKTRVKVRVALSRFLRRSSSKAIHLMTHPEEEGMDSNGGSAIRSSNETSPSKSRRDRSASDPPPFFFRSQNAKKQEDEQHPVIRRKLRLPGEDSKKEEGSSPPPVVALPLSPRARTCAKQFLTTSPPLLSAKGRSLDTLPPLSPPPEQSEASPETSLSATP
eukprot:TRINITY_DN3404_c0_g1_i2.p1 TRINITY_DN3404_c0_g1~~TRINITY_DN3404_c0_g1_i2.p1  ORF type:complete len:329 (+),score=67.23 TRINITY_DN3404_c0_g1_i2:384-1370(+)